MATHRHRTLVVVIGVLALLGGSVGSAQAGFLHPALQASTPTIAATEATSRATVAAGLEVRNVVASRKAAISEARTAAASPASVPSLDASPSGVSAPRGDLPGWHQVYAEDFTTPNATGTFPSAGYEKHWDVYADGWKDTSHNGTYMPSQVLSVHGGVLDYNIRTVAGQHQVAAPWVTDTSGHAYGRYSIRFHSDALPGYKTAWLLWPDSERWPSDGEIDFPEGNLGSGDTISAFSHYASSRGGQDQFASKATFAGWHTVTVEWVPGKVTFVLDGKVLGVSTTMVPSTAMHWVLQTETNLDGYAPSSAVQGHVLVDWVAFWSRA